MDGNNQEIKKKKKWILPVIIGSIVVLFTVLVAVIVAVSLAVTAPKRALKKQLDLGKKYMTEFDYDNAIQAFEEAIRIDPKNEEAYLALIDICEKKAEACKEENPQEAVEYLEKGKQYASDGVREVGSEALKKKTNDLDEEIAECKKLDQETMIEQAKLVRQKDLYEYFFCERNKVDIDKVWIPTKMTTYAYDGEVMGFWTCEYTKTENGYHEVYLEYDYDGSFLRRTEYDYNAEGFVIHSDHYEGDQYADSYDYEYDDDGILKTCVWTSEWGGWSQTTSYFEWNSQVLGYEANYKEYRYDEYGDLENPDGAPYMPNCIWIGDMTKGWFIMDSFPDEYTYEILEDNKLKEDPNSVGYYMVYEFERLSDIGE